MVRFSLLSEKRRVRPSPPVPTNGRNAAGVSTSKVMEAATRKHRQQDSIQSNRRHSGTGEFTKKNDHFRRSAHHCHHEQIVSDPGFHVYRSLERDPKYLLRLCERNDWKNVERCCDMLQKLFGNQAATADLLNAAQQQVVSTDQWGNAALHMVCYYHKPPLGIVSALIAATADAFRVGNGNQLFLLPNYHGATPLMIACRSGGSQQVIHLLMTEKSRRLVSPCHRAADLSDLDGNTTFSGLVQRYTMLCKIPHFKRYCTPLSEQSDSTRQVSGEEHASVCTVPTELRPSFATNGEHYSAGNFVLEDNQDPAMIFPLFWETIGLLIDASWNDCTSHDASLTLRQSLVAGQPVSPWTEHAIASAAFVAHALPQSVIDLLFRLHHDEQERCPSGPKEDNTSQVLPLHLAVIREQSMHAHANLVDQRAYMIHCLLQKDPSAACTRMPHSTRWTFHQAIASGLTWHIGNGHDENSKVDGPIKKLFELTPDLLRVKDPETGLYPFQLAATEQELPAGDDETWSSRARVDTVYQLLKEAPELILPG